MSFVTYIPRKLKQLMIEVWVTYDVWRITKEYRKWVEEQERLGKAEGDMHRKRVGEDDE